MRKEKKTQNKTLVFSACFKTGGCKIKDPKSKKKKKNRVCAVGKNRNETTLQVLTEYTELGRIMQRRRLLWLVSVCFAK